MMDDELTERLDQLVGTFNPGMTTVGRELAGLDKEDRELAIRVLGMYAVSSPVDKLPMAEFVRQFNADFGTFFGERHLKYYIENHIAPNVMLDKDMVMRAIAKTDTRVDVAVMQGEVATKIHGEFIEATIDKIGVRGYAQLAKATTDALKAHQENMEAIGVAPQKKRHETSNVFAFVDARGAEDSLMGRRGRGKPRNDDYEDVDYQVKD